MCCLVDKELPLKSRRAYSGGFFQSYNPKKLRTTAAKYSSDRHPSVSHGKFVNVGEYVVMEGKRAVLVTAADVASEFQTLARQWKRETIAASSLSDMFTHPAYQRIMAMGKPALPFILRDLQRNSGHWFHALRFIVGKDIATGSETVSDARSAWLEWGYKNGYL